MSNAKKYYLRKNMKVAEMSLKQEEDWNKRSHNEIKSKKKKNAELCKEYGKYK